MLEGILHNPYGLEHPYKQEPTERFPRNPQEGQAVGLGLATWPAGAASEIWATWHIGDEPEEQRARGEWREDKDSRSYWHIQLPSFQGGRRVSYQLHAKTEGHQIDSRDFSFFVRKWHSTGDLLNYRLTPECLELECRLSHSERSSHVRLSFSETGFIRISLSLDKESMEIRHDAFRRQFSYTGIEENDERIEITTEIGTLTIFRSPCRVTIRQPDGALLLQEAMPPTWLLGEGDVSIRVRQTFESPSEEGFYGFGERFNALNQRGNTLDIRVFEQYTHQGQKTYLPVPFFISSRGYGHYVATNRHIVYDLADASPNQWTLDAQLGQAACLNHIIFPGSPTRILRTLTDVIGKPCLPPHWVFGPWMSGNEWNSQTRVMKEVRKTLEHNIPATVLVIEAWSDETTFYIWNDAEYTPKPADQAFTYADFSFPPNGRWPDPKGMIEELHSLGIHVILWQIPVMKHIEDSHVQHDGHAQHDSDEALMLQKGYCVKDADGQPYRVRPFWFHNALLPDFTNPEAAAWWLDKRTYLLEELGIDGFKTDGGEHLWGEGLRFSNNQKGDEGWNLYPNLYVGAYHAFAREKRAGDAVTFSRAGFTGAQKYPLHWAGDQDSTWEAFRSVIVAGLNAGICGIPFWGWDIAGFSGEIPSAELYLRSAAAAVFAPIMQYHSEYNAHRKPCRDRTPWNIAERTGQPEVMTIYQRFAQLRMELLNYIHAEAAHCHETGEPMMRALFLDWPDDPQVWKITGQYGFGRNLLVAPVLEPDTTQRSLYLPQGEWEDFWDGSKQKGGQWITRDVPLDIIPVYRNLTSQHRVSE